MGAGFAINAAEVFFDGVVGEIEDGCDFAVGFPGADPVEDFLFAWRELPSGGGFLGEEVAVAPPVAHQGEADGVVGAGECVGCEEGVWATAGEVVEAVFDPRA